MERFEELKQKYASVLDLIQQEGVVLAHLHVQDNKLVIQGAAPSEQIKNDVWDRIKSVDADYSDVMADISVDSSLPQPARASASSAPVAQKYTVVAGDSLSKIAKQVYGDATQYMKIFEANTDVLHDPNKIQIGQELKIPAK